MEADERAAATLKYVKAKFREYYRSHPLQLPPRFGRREFGFIFFDGGFVQRHLGFSSEANLHQFVRSRLPAHLYHSAAYYENPGAPTMAEKGWMGADLIFDLDADHIPGWTEMGYRGMLEAVKEQVIRLTDEFLLGDMGFGEKDMTIAFSGARGYHVHVRDPKVFGLESHERREIVDYITGTDLDLGTVARSEPFESRTFKEVTRTLRRLRVPTPSEPGWRGRVSRGIIDWLDRVSRMTEEEALEELQRLEGVGKVRATKIYDTMFKRLGRDRVIDRVRSGALDLFPKGGGQSIVAQGANLMKGATDEPVTSDVKRLIRLIGSLHGKTGLRVVPVSRDLLEPFDPLVEALPDEYSQERIRIRLQQGIKTDMMGETFNLEPGQNSVPEYLAIFLMCRGVATLASGTMDEGTSESD